MQQHAGCSLCTSTQHALPKRLRSLSRSFLSEINTNTNDNNNDDENNNKEAGKLRLGAVQVNGDPRREWLRRRTALQVPPQGRVRANGPRVQLRLALVAHRLGSTPLPSSPTSLVLVPLPSSPPILRHNVHAGPLSHSPTSLVLAPSPPPLRSLHRLQQPSSHDRSEPGQRHTSARTPVHFGPHAGMMPRTRISQASAAGF